MNKKGFTLIELLAVIVILAVIALIVTPIVTGIIASAKEAANARSVEGHIKSVEYATLEAAFKDGSGQVTLLDGADLSEAQLQALFPAGIDYPQSNDSITCRSYTIVNGLVTEAYECAVKEGAAKWKYSFDLIKGGNATKSSTPVE